MTNDETVKYMTARHTRLVSELHTIGVSIPSLEDYRKLPKKKREELGERLSRFGTALAAIELLERVRPELASERERRRKKLKR